VCQAEKSNEQHMLFPSSGRQWINPSKRLVDRAIERWNGQNLRADNTSVVTVMLDPPGIHSMKLVFRTENFSDKQILSCG
jgi:protein phosphatase 1D